LQAVGRSITLLGIGLGSIAWLLMVVWLLLTNPVFSEANFAVSAMKIAPIMAFVSIVCSCYKPKEMWQGKLLSFGLGASWLIVYYLVVQKH
jgi:hypothetical protein